MRPFFCAPGAGGGGRKEHVKTSGTNRQAGRTDRETKEERPTARDGGKRRGRRAPTRQRRTATPFVVVVSPARRPKKKRGRRGGRRAMT